jgi:hypothetical protein
MLGLLWIACTTEPAAPPAPPPPAPVKKRAPPKPRKPKPKPCLGTADVAGDAGMAASEGLSPAQVSSTMRTAFSAMAQCVAQSGAAPSAPLDLRITVSCGGVVDRVEVADPGDWPADAISCTRAAVELLEFPAHGLPDGDTFEFPLTWSAP